MNNVDIKAGDNIVYVGPDKTVSWDVLSGVMSGLATSEEKLKELPMSHRDTRKFARFFLAGATQVEVDKQGRILIPNVLREFAGLEKDVVFLGVGSRIEIWSRQAWDGIP